MSTFLDIDGSMGEGGGQIIRSALGLSLFTGRPFRIANIRARRRKPGLRRQHVVAVQAAARIGCARVAGNELGSGSLSFEPGGVVPGDYRFDIGTAGSTTLVLQAVLPGLLCCGATTTLTIEGGTHNPMCPPFDFLQQAFLPLLARMGARVDVALERVGFYPAGGGRIRATVRPADRLQPLELHERGGLLSREAIARVALLDTSIAERELEVLRRKLDLRGDEARTEVIRDSRGPGNTVTVALRFEHVTEVFTAVGERHKRAEVVATEVGREAQNYLKSNAPVGEHLADQLLIPLAMAGGGSFVTTTLTTHGTTNMDVVRMFLPVRFTTERAGSKSVRVTVTTC